MTEPTRHSVSYSETSAYTLCQRKHWYSYTKSLTRRVESTRLGTGTAGHAILQTFYNKILEAGDTIAKQKKALKVAKVAAWNKYQELLIEGYKDADDRAPLEEVLFDFYIANEPYVSEGWLIQAVEMEFRLDVEVAENELISTPGAIDLIAVDPRGKTVIIDHKFIYDYYSDDMVALMPQIPLYIAALRGLGHKVDYGQYNMLRTRSIKGTKNKDGSYPGATWEQRRLGFDVAPNATRVKRTFEEQIDIAVEIQERKLLPLDVLDIKSHRVANKMVCQSCDFKDLCKIELLGGNAALVEKNEFKIRERKVFAEESIEAESE
jgi:RecB family exonuclease